MLKKTLIALGVLAVAGSAAAADITNPFYLPAKGQVGSITSVGFDRAQYKFNTDESLNLYNTVAQEELQYGLTDNLTLWGYFGNTFAKGKWTGELSGKEDENLNWGAGLTWNIVDKAFKLQVALGYNQDKLYGTLYDTSGEYKYLTGKIKAGYQLKTMLPYVEIGEKLPIAQTNAEELDKPTYTAKIGLYQGKCETWALDTGLRVTHDENEIEATTYDVEAEASYYLTKNSALSLYGTYTLDGKAKDQTDIYDKSVGLRLRWFF